MWPADGDLGYLGGGEGLIFGDTFFGGAGEWEIGAPYTYPRRATLAG
jgi:hypothetical protein